MTLDNIDISNMLWIDQFNWGPIAQQSDRTITGGLVVQEGVKKFGQPITLTDSWLPKTTVDALKAKEAIGGLKMLLTLDNGATHSVIFNRSRGAAVEATQVFPNTDAPADWQYETTISLFTVQP
ncbi:hypothetical protein [Reinekea sp.]|jgi:hypothetical protein|uniref:hypothetical protein n=1 Tax=Reinekea sp. TaxID=1970455 RepID=UPI003989242E